MHMGVGGLVCHTAQVLGSCGPDQQGVCASVHVIVRVCLCGMGGA